MAEPLNLEEETPSEHDTLKYSLLGPSLTKAGQDSVDQSKVSEIIYNASKGSKYFNREEVKDKILTQKIEQILVRKAQLEQENSARDLRLADQLIEKLEASRYLDSVIVHVDCDAFYAACELLERPELRDVPFAVGGGVLTTCNYVARKFGCRSGMAGFVAKKLCPQLVLLPTNFDRYTAKAHEVREVLADYDPRFESASIDEAYLDITDYCADHEMAPADVVQQMRDEIHQKTKITVSAGIAANAKLAKICSNMNKPNGQYLLPSDRNAILSFMGTLPCRKVNGIGRVLERELAAIGIINCGDIYPQRHMLNKLFGEKTFEFLMCCYLGLGRTRIQPAEEYVRKSVGTESTFHEIADGQKFREKLRWTAEELEKDLKRTEFKGRTLCLKIKLHSYEVFTRQVVVPKAIWLADDLYNYSLPMLEKLEQEMPRLRLRLMGLRCTHLVSTKRPNTMAFFGFRTRHKSNDEVDGVNGKRKLEDIKADDLDQWLETEATSLSQGSPAQQEDESAPHRHHGKEITPNPKKRQESPSEDVWDCPICARPQPAVDKLFNEHIDLCLSRQTIRDAIQVDRASPSAAGDAVVQKSKRVKTAGERPKPMSESDPRQKKLSFG